MASSGPNLAINPAKATKQTQPVELTEVFFSDDVERPPGHPRQEEKTVETGRNLCQF
jgi:hypothetical protein